MCINGWTTLTSQNPEARFKILYNTSGKYLAACVIENKPLSTVVNGLTIESNGVVAGHTTYYYDIDTEEEAFYIITGLNAPIIDRLIKRMQAKVFLAKDI